MTEMTEERFNELDRKVDKILLDISKLAVAIGGDPQLKTKGLVQRVDELEDGQEKIQNWTIRVGAGLAFAITILGSLQYFGLI